MKVALASPWAEAVFHVLAHVAVTDVAASCWSPSYVAWAAVRFGDPSQRSLAEDARVLGAAAPTHDLLARIQALAWVFDDAASVDAASTRDLAELGPADVADARALAAAQHAGPAVEILRAAAELELPLFAHHADVCTQAVARALDRVMPAAPSIEACTVALARPLGARGRVFGASILAGVPDVACPGTDHVAWQIAHEATVREIDVAHPGHSFVDIERAAIQTLRARADVAGLAEEHARWLARLDLSGLGLD